MTTPFFACRHEFVGQVANLRPIVNRPAAPAAALAIFREVN
jgi:hypothetical protein